MSSNRLAFWEVPPGVVQFDRLPSSGVMIHPAMSEALDPVMQKVCERFGISVWDREKVFRALSAINPNPENV